MDSNQIMMKEIRAVLTEDENADYSDSKAVRAILDRIREGKLNSTFYGKNYEKQVAKAIVEGPEDYVCLICKKPSSPRMVCEECRNKIFPNRDRTIEDKPEEATEPEIMPEPEISAEPEVVPEPEISAEPKVIPEPEISAEPEVVPEPEISAEPEVMPETEITVDTGAVYPQESVDPDEGEAAGIEIDEETLSAMSVSEVEDDAEEVKSIENEPLTEPPAEETGPSVQELFAGDLSVENEMTPQELFSEATPQEFFTAATPADEIPPQQLMKKDDAGEPESESTLTKDITGKLGDAVDKFTEKINVMAGGSGKVDLRLRDLFSGVFKRHDSGEAEKIFICGTKETTPDRANISAEWPKPWLYTRVFLVLFITFVLLMLCYTIFKNTNVIPGIIFVGSACVPFSVLVFLFEINAPRNISIFEVARVFCLGGAASLFVTLILYIFEGAQNGIIEAILIGIIEEAGKLLIVAFLIGHRPKNNYILNGMLYGGAVGTGFAVFESMGYAMNIYMGSGFFGLFQFATDNAFDKMVNVIGLRAFLSPGGHIAWAAMEGAFLLIVLGGKEFKWSAIISPKYLTFLAIPVALHAVWDMPILNFSILFVPVKQTALSVIAWIIILVFLHRGLSEINEI